MLMGITRVLVANRGEIARRVFATCRRLGLGTVAVYTDPDAAAPHAAEADARVRLPQTTDYLNAEAIIAAAQAAGADAVHPGYGFLSENAEFAAAVQEAGLTWVGPPVDAVRAMGSKIESKKLMAAAGVPVLEELDPDAVTTAQLPVLVKASAGGGGRGMRVVHELSALPAEVEAARREAQSAFGDPTVFCERYLPTGHHVEVQVMADTHGTVWAVGERECSIQRRHQKIIEEAPSPLVERVQVKTYRDDADTEHRVEYRFTRTGLALPGDPVVQLVSADVDQVVLAQDGVAHGFTVARHGPDVYVDSARGPVHLVALSRFPEPSSAVEQGSLVAPMPGNVIRIGAEVGDTVTAGQPLIWLEAMKMEHTIAAPADGVLTHVSVNTGQQVEVGAILARVEAPQNGPAEGDPP